MKTCPQCGLLNPDDGAVCECGFDLVHGDATAAAGVRRATRRRGRLYQIGGLALVIFGIAGGNAIVGLGVPLYVSFGSHRADLGLIIVGGVLIADAGKRKEAEAAPPGELVALRATLLVR